MDAGCSSPERKRRKIDESDKLVEETDECYINHLPYEILCMIFQQLHFEDQKQCRLICQRWFAILRSKPFMEHIRFNFPHCFGSPINEQGQQQVSNCFHCVFHDFGSIPLTEEERLLQKPSSVADDAPGPSTRVSGMAVEKFLFNDELRLRTLELKSSFDRLRQFVGDRLQQLIHLHELRLIVLLKSKGDLRPEEAPLWIVRHGSLRSLVWELFDNTNGYELALPMLESLTVEVANDFDLDSLAQCNTHLVELNILLYFTRAFEQMLLLPFPKLTKLVMTQYRNKKDSPDPPTQADDLAAEHFFTNMPALRDITLAENFVTFRLFRPLCLFRVDSLTRLTIRDVSFPHSLFMMILELKQLTFLRLKYCCIRDGSRLREVDLPHLRHLELIKSGTCLRLDDGLSNVRRFKYSMDSRLSKVCRHMLMLEDFEIKLRTKIPVAEDIRDHFHSLPLLANLRVLRISGMKTTTRPWDFCRPMPTVEHLVLRKCHFLRCHFKDLPRLFPSLRRLELDGTCIGYKRVPKTVTDPLQHFHGRLKEYLPSCQVSINRSSSAHVIKTMLQMEDEYRWHLNIVRSARIEIVEGVGMAENYKAKK